MLSNDYIEHVHLLKKDSLYIYQAAHSAHLWALWASSLSLLMSTVSLHWAVCLQDIVHWIYTFNEPIRMMAVTHFYLNIMTKATEWPKSLLFIQSNLNNIKSNFTDKMPNKMIYEFSLNVIFTFNIAAESILPLLASWIEVTDVIDFAKMNIKYHYNWKHQPLVMWVGNYALLQLHCEYSISAITNKKLKQQYVELF